MQNYPSRGTGSNPFYFSTSVRGGGSSSNLNAQASAAGGATADGMGRIKAKLDELDRVLLEGKGR